jgi:hypothetical protein
LRRRPHAHFINYATPTHSRRFGKRRERIVRRDFRVIEFDSVIAVLKGYEESASGRRERPRVQLAALKLADGHIEALRAHINTAIQDFRMF